MLGSLGVECIFHRAWSGKARSTLSLEPTTRHCSVSRCSPQLQCRATYANAEPRERCNTMSIGLYLQFAWLCFFELLFPSLSRLYSACCRLDAGVDSSGMSDDKDQRRARIGRRRIGLRTIKKGKLHIALGLLCLTASYTETRFPARIQLGLCCCC